LYEGEQRGRHCESDRTEGEQRDPAAAAAVVDRVEEGAEDERREGAHDGGQDHHQQEADELRPVRAREAEHSAEGLPLEPLAAYGVRVAPEAGHRLPHHRVIV
jgi:hypothetical protein